MTTENDPLSIEQATAKTVAHFERQSGSENITVALVGTTAVTIMEALKGQRMRISERMFDLEQRLSAVEKKDDREQAK